MAPYFDHEKLDAYKLALLFIEWVTPVIKLAKKDGMGISREVCEQLDRASLSILLNIAEGNGKRARQLRARYFDDARGSATECAACLDALVAKSITQPENIHQGKELLSRIVAVLTKLVACFNLQDGNEMRDAELSGLEYGNAG